MSLSHTSHRRQHALYAILAMAIVAAAAAAPLDLEKIMAWYKEGLLSDAEFAEAKRRLFSDRVEVTPGGDRSETRQQQGSSDVFLVSKKEIGELLSQSMEAREDALLARFATLKKEIMASIERPVIAPSGKPPRRQLNGGNENSASAVGATTQLHLKADDGKIALGSAADVSLYRASISYGGLTPNEKCYATCLQTKFATFDTTTDGAIDKFELAAKINDGSTCTMSKCATTCPTSTSESQTQCQEKIMAEFDTNTNKKIEYSEITGSLQTDNDFVAASLTTTGTFSGALACPKGFWSIANGRLCMSKELQTPQVLAGPARKICAEMSGARICTHDDYNQACSPSSSGVSRTCTLNQNANPPNCKNDGDCAGEKNFCRPNPFQGVDPERAGYENGWYGNYVTVGYYPTWNKPHCIGHQKEQSGAIIDYEWWTVDDISSNIKWDAYSYTFRCCV